MYKLLNRKNKARRGELKTRRGIVQTPTFMPVATKASLKTIAVTELEKLAPEVILGNTYHLMLRPGEKEIKKLGGMHEFMGWRKPILTDSGGFQVFSLARIRKISATGIEFNSHIDGRKFNMTPADSIRIQTAIGSDIMMVLDECVEIPAKRNYLRKSIALTTEWAEQSKKACQKYCKNEKKKPLLFAIVQGGLEQDLRLQSAEQLQKIGFDGYAIGGLSVGESEREMYQVLDYTVPALPENKPRYLMGVGYPHQIVEAVKRGVDMFDCVIPAREARHGRLYNFSKIKNGILDAGKGFYQTANAKAEKFKFDTSPINAESEFSELRNYSKAYLRHLFVTEDSLAQRLATLNNLEFYLTMMRRIREELS